MDVLEIFLCACQENCNVFATDMECMYFRHALGVGNFKNADPKHNRNQPRAKGICHVGISHARGDIGTESSQSAQHPLPVRSHAQRHRKGGREGCVRDEEP